MLLYTYVSIFTVLVTTIILYIIFRRNDLKDCRYHIGLLVSAVIALIASLFLPKMVSAISVDLALQFVLAFFIALLAYITLIFIVMMIVAAVIPKEKSDKITEKWEEWKVSRKEKKIGKPDKGFESVQDNEDDPQQQEPVLKSIFIRKYSLKKDENELKEPEEDNLQEMPAEATDPEFIPEGYESVESEPEDLTDIADDETVTDEEQEIQPEDSYGTETGEECEPETVTLDELQEEEKKEAEFEQKPTEDKDYSEQYEDFQGFLVEKGENTEKNVDTLDIIDKMGLGTISDSVELSTVQLSLDELLDRAFQLKREGRELEAASLYINALDMEPDTEVAFWIVLDICVIFRDFGQSELAAEILQAYINEYNDLMSDEVKEQILQSLYI